MSGFDNQLFAEGGNDSDKDFLGSIVEPILDVLSDILKMFSVGKVDIFFHIKSLLVEHAEAVVIYVLE